MTLQVARMRDVLAALRRAAQADGGTGAQPRPAPVWLAELLQHWRDLRAAGSVELLREGRGEPPVLGDEPLLNAALVTLLNNAADAAQGPVTVRLDWDARNLDLEVLDRGPGLSASVAKPEGWGVGLLLARTAVEHLGGSLRLAPREGGGLRAWLRLPLPLARTG
jgi:two-component system sensor histidine kinase RegB